MNWIHTLIVATALVAAGCQKDTGPVPPGPGPVPDVQVDTIERVAPEKVWEKFAQYVEAKRFKNTDELVGAVNQAKAVGDLPKGPEFDQAFPEFAKKQAIIDDRNRAEIARILRQIRGGR